MEDQDSFTKGIIECTKILLQKIVTLDTNLNKTYYISLIINNLKPQDTPLFEFSSKGERKINKIFSLENNETIKKVIKFEFYEKVQMFSNLILKGEIYNENFILDNATTNYICYLKDNEGIEKAILYYDLQYSQKEKFKSAEVNKDLKRIEKINERFEKNERDTIQKEKIDELFLLNLEYIDKIIQEIYLIINWNNKWKTISYLFLFTFILLFFRPFYVFILPLSIIYFHLTNKNKIEKFIIMRDSNVKDKMQVNQMIFYNIMFIYNKIINIYENIIRKIINGKKQIIKQLYRRLIVSIFIKFLLDYFKIKIPINFRLIIVVAVWTYVLRRNPSFYSFSFFIENIIQERTLFITGSRKFFYYKTNLVNMISILLPFSSMYRLYKVEDEEFSNSDNNLLEPLNREGRMSRTSSKNSSSSINENLNIPKKYELYENERWWMLVGWDKTLIFNEVPVWYNVKKPDEYCDKEKVTLPDEDGRYKWNGDWKIEKNDNTDELGWEYSYNFDGHFGRYGNDTYVRRRKWTRFAKKIV